MTASALLVEPAFFTCPDYARTLGPEVGELATLAGFPPDPEQQMLLDAIFALDRYGKSAAFDVTVICSRQNLKTGLLKQAALGKAFIMERPLFVWSAHEFRTAQEAFRDLTVLIESCPDLDREVRRVYRGSGAESIELFGGQRIIFKARTKSGGRGLTGDDVALDEAFALQPDHVGALLPTLSARPDPQVLVASSAGLASSEVLRGFRDRGRPGSARSVYAEWCAPPPAEVCAAGEQCTHEQGTDGCGCDDPGNWQRSNPAMGRRITIGYIRDERRALPPEEFGRERMGWWDDPDVDTAALSYEKWMLLEDAASSLDMVGAFGVEISLDRAVSSIGVAGPRVIEGELERVHVELVERHRGTGWLLARCIELDKEHRGPVFVIDGYGPAANLIPDLEDAGLRVVTAASKDVAAACVGMVDAVADGLISHGPQQELDQAIAGAKKRSIGDGAYAFGRKVSTVDITPLVAVTLARWGNENYGYVTPGAFAL